MSRRIIRIRELREKALDAARIALEAAVSQREAAEAVLESARAEVVRARDALHALDTVTAGDLVVHSAHVDACQRRAAFAAQGVDRRRGVEAHAREAVNEARIKVRQIELWQENVASRERERAEVEERKLHDALAARSARGNP